MESQLKVKSIPIIRMDCPTCIPVLEKQVKNLKGVEDARGNYIAKKLEVTYDPAAVELADIENAIERIGYQISYKKYPSLIKKFRSLFKREKPDKIKPIKDSEFPGKVLHSSRTVGVLFSSETCPICRVLKRELGKIQEKTIGRIELYEMDISATETWRNYDVLTIPTLIVFKNGEISEKFEALPKNEDIESALRS